MCYLYDLSVLCDEMRCKFFRNSSTPPPDLPHQGGGNAFPPPLVGGVRGGG